MSIKFTNVCRICLKLSDSKQTMDRKSGKVTLRDMLKYCFSNFELSNSQQTQALCRPCAKQLIACYKFKKKYEQSTRKLQTLVASSHTKLPGEDTQIQAIDPDEDTGNDQDHLDDVDDKVILKTEQEEDLLEDIADAEDIPLAALSAYCTAPVAKRKIKKNIEGPIARYRCSACSLTTDDRALWLEHLKVHPYTRFLCSYCAKGFKNEFALRVHTRHHTLDKPFKCEVCARGFTQKHSLVVHERALHRREKPFHCALCDARFPRKEALAIHERAHAGSRPYACATCGKRFGQRANLATHRKLHTGDKPYACGECSFRTAYSSALKKHARAHRGERAHPCALCPKAFRDNSALTRHRRTHTGELPYACAHCPRAFIDSWKRSQHAARAHPASAAPPVSSAEP